MATVSPDFESGETGSPSILRMAKKIKLQQDQVWKRGEEYLRILHLERLEVEYKSVKSLTTREGAFHHVSKKEFCRLIKTAHLMTTEEIQKSWYH
jgi:acyl CoA:acetate/3-ketoacid CoA transferase beta subunit